MFTILLVGLNNFAFYLCFYYYLLQANVFSYKTTFFTCFISVFLFLLPFTTVFSRVSSFKTAFFTSIFSIWNKSKHKEKKIRLITLHYALNNVFKILMKLVKLFVNKQLTFFANNFVVFIINFHHCTWSLTFFHLNLI